MTETPAPVTIRTARGEVEYAVTGAGPTVLALHGAMGGWDQSMLLARTVAPTSFRAVARSRPFERNVIHLAHRDATMVAISRAPIEKLLGFQKRFGWTFKWVSSGRSDFNYDQRVSFEAGKAGQIYNFAPKTMDASELPGISVFYRDTDGNIYRTYATYARGVEMVNAAFHYLDLLPKGRDEEGQRPMSWLRLRDEYDVPA
jgi:predicted dithiol-disulfide oxidoreductase (DUF899 family)